MRRMLDEQVIPRLLKLGGITGVARLKRFHSFGIGESRADNMLADMPALQNGAAIKLGFQAHFPELETKLALRGETDAELLARLAPVEAEVRKRLGNFIVAEDDQTLEGVVLATLLERGYTVATAEMFTGGHLAARLAPLAGAERAFRHGIVVRDPAELGINGVSPETADRSGATCGTRPAPATRSPCWSSSTKAPTGPISAARSASASPTLGPRFRARPA